MPTPPNPNADCAVLHAASCDLFQWLTAQRAVKEESLTDRLLYEIARHSSNFIYKAFTRHEEARKTGADWEWWIVLPAYALRLRIQAKKIYGPPYDHYKDLAYTNKYGLQIMKLIGDAKATNAVPLYALYSAQALSSLLCPLGPQAEGAFLASANTIFDKFIASGPVHVGNHDLFAISTPLSCLICCTAASDPARFVYHYFPEGLAQPSPGLPLQGLHTTIPKHVALLLEAKGRIPEWWETEFSAPLAGLDAILIYDGRGTGATG
jgi:hypothetical protein